jgi:hypothetical protein
MRDTANAFGNLYDNLNVQTKKIKKRKKPVYHEDVEQIILVTWLTKLGVPFYHVPNGGKRSWKESVKFRSLGVKAGIPDLCLPFARSSYHGLYIELKRQSGGSTSDAQRFWLHLLNENGYKAVVCKGAEEAKKVVMEYLSL